jgi:hypothetical protein
VNKNVTVPDGSATPERYDSRDAARSSDLIRQCRHAPERVGELQRVPRLAAANAWFQYWFPIYGDIGGLDANHDGILCETLPGAP